MYGDITSLEQVKALFIMAFSYTKSYTDIFVTLTDLLYEILLSTPFILFEGFSREVYRSDHPSNTKTGGVCLYFREGLAIKRRQDLEIMQEIVVSEMCVARKKIFFVVLYRSPSQNSAEFENFIDGLQLVVTRIQNENPYSLTIMGDFNCRSNQWWSEDIENIEGSVLDELLDVNNLHQLIGEPTNIRGESMSCIDLIITDQPNLFVETGVHPSLDNNCQRQIIHGMLNITLPSPPPYKRTVWEYKKANTCAIKGLLNDINWASKFNGLGSEEMANIFTDNLLSILSANIPNREIKCNDKDPPWVTSALKTAIKRKHRLYRNYMRRGRNTEDWERVRTTRNETSKLITSAKQMYLLSLGQKLSDPNQGKKPYWSIFNRLINKKSAVNIPPLLENAMIKICDECLVEPLSVIFKECLETGVYPSRWKRANIIPVHKKGNRQNKKNYRPISLLPIFGKIFEKVIFDEIYQYLCNNQMLTPHQSGFRPGDSTINQLLLIRQKIYAAFDEVPSKETRAVFLDLSKAFDRVWHDGLIYKLEMYGISGMLLALLRSFLSNRRQRVLLNGRNSEWKMVSSGVPQGSVLGPLFFLIYINDLLENVHSGIKLFAADTSLFSVVKSEGETAEDLNRDLERILLWAWQWKMQFNADKTEEVIFSMKRNKPYHPVLKLGNEEVSRKNEHKHLGVILDDKLNFQSHIKEAVAKARRGIGIIKYLSRYVNREVLDQVYKLRVRPHLDYGDILYHKYDPEIRQDFTRKLEQVQYCAALAVSGAWKGTSGQKVLQELGWETLYQRRWYRRLCHFFNLRKSMSPAYLFNEIPSEREVPYPLRSSRPYAQPVSRTDRFSNTYFQSTPFEWNLLDEDTRNSVSIGEFKRKLLVQIRPPCRPVYNVHNVTGVRNLTRLRVGFSPLNEHRFRHNFDCLSPLCVCGKGNEDTEHFLLHCPLFDNARSNLFGQLGDIPKLEFSVLDNEALSNLLLFGDRKLNIVSNRMILEATILFIEKTKRLH